MKYKYRYVDQAKKILEDEEGFIHKDWGGRLPIALVYPNTYHLGMSSLGLHAVYRSFNDHPDVVCERAFWGYKAVPRSDEPVISLESQRPLEDFAVLAFTISYELDFFNVIQVLRRSGIPLLAEDRDETWPLIVAGGPAVYGNPAPLADIVDVFAIGEVEEIGPRLVDGLQEACYMVRPDGLSILAELPGVYVPALENGPVKRLSLKNLDSQPACTQVFAHNTEFGDRGLLEIGRGCGRGCRFCMAGFVYRPVREVSLAKILDVSAEMLRNRQKLGLVSAAVSDHSQIDQIAVGLRAMGAKIAIASMRVDPISEPLLRALAESGTKTVTIAPEAGSVRLRQIINKTQTDQQLLDAVDLVAGYQFPQLKMYFMIGHPTEREDDVKEIINLVLAARERFSRQLTITVAPYVPKAHTPFQWVEMAPVETLQDRIAYLEKSLRPVQVTVRSDSPAWAVVEAVLARGDRRLGRALIRMRKPGLREWRRALAEEGLSEAEYIRERSIDEWLPWHVVDMGVGRNALVRDLDRSLAGKSTPACVPQGCSRCEACGED